MSNLALDMLYISFECTSRSWDSPYVRKNITEIYNQHAEGYYILVTTNTFFCTEGPRRS